jgi:hypothetical protein
MIQHHQLRVAQRLGTVYLGQMPEAGQATLTYQLTQLLVAVFARWQGMLPRLVYITDAGACPQDYFRSQLACMTHSRTGERLRWQWIVVYFHACKCISTLAESLLGTGRDAPLGPRDCRKDFDRAIELLEKVSPAHELCRLPPSQAADWQRRDRSSLQNNPRLSLQAIGHALDERARTTRARPCGVILKSGVWASAHDAWLADRQSLKIVTPPIPHDKSMKKTCKLVLRV